MSPLVRALWNRLLGDAGERAAARHLRARGLRVLTRGYRTPLGEIDLIAREGKTLVFVEVKTRRAGHPAEAVTPEKQRRLTRAALQFVRRFGLQDHPCRFDVVAVVWPDDRLAPAVEHVRNAFEPPETGRPRPCAPPPRATDPLPSINCETRPRPASQRRARDCPWWGRNARRLAKTGGLGNLCTDRFVLIPRGPPGGIAVAEPRGRTRRAPVPSGSVRARRSIRDPVEP